MSRKVFVAASLLALVTMASGCARHDDNLMDKAVENTKDALDTRDHEKLKDAGESAHDAVKEAADGIKDAAHDAKDQVKDATGG